MLAKLSTIALNWLLASVIMPVLRFAYDMFKLRKENKELKEKITNLKNAKTKDEIDSAIDRIN